MTKVLITFFSIDGSREQLALACGVGAVEARGSIRLRRLPDRADSVDLPESPDVLARMRREYVVPTEDDIAWADVLVFCGPEGRGGAWVSYLDLLTRLASESALDGKVGVVLDAADAATSSADSNVKSDSVWAGILSGLGLVTVPARANGVQAAGATDALVEARTTGRRAVAVARALARGATTRRDAASLF